MKSTTNNEQKKISMLVTAIDKIYPSTKKLIWRSFLHGLFIGLGTTVGVSIVLAIVTYTLSQLRLIPFLNSVIDEKSVEKIFPGR